MAMDKPYATLRGALRRGDIDYKYLAKQLDRSLQYVVDRMNARAAWRVDEAYKILDILREPPERFRSFFPPAANRVEIRRRANV